MYRSNIYEKIYRICIYNAWRLLMGGGSMERALEFLIFFWYTLPVLVYLVRSHIFQLYIVVHV
jgi:hypothetical protein